MNRLLRLTLLLAFVAAAASAQTPQDVSVCDLLGDLSGKNGSLVRLTVNIEFDGLPERGPALSGSSCAAEIAVNGIRFLNLISITDPQNKLFRIHDVDFDWDTVSHVEFERMLLQLDPKSEHIKVTVVGVFETRTPLGDLVKINKVHPGGIRLGFGPFSELPAQILVKTMTDMQIEKN